MHIADAPQFVRSLAAELASKERIDAHLRFGRPLPRKGESCFEHCVRRGHGVDDAVL